MTFHRASVGGTGVVNPKEIMMDREELAFWEQIRRRGAFWYLVHKGLLFLLAYPLLGHFAIGWDWHPRIFLEAWVVIWPTFHLSQLALGLAGVEQFRFIPTSFAAGVLLGVTVLCGGLAIRRLARHG